ncbi:N-acetyltransferase [Saccharobesus litoralis]|uniref:N-acetyltransferase n=1 Tax=Saccharobesus litoralis TaxID=2172099 RepID=A0A2S0VL71_9ALTE|nr:GNAT family N-acetyltransferase [Saccharobesus litoralis]AWB64952.1 N-acetyltransferase [Saccharobesus litoralis]
MEIRPILFSDTLSLRHQILRPDLEFDQCIYPGDKMETTHHLGGFIEGNHLGILTIYKRSKPEEFEGQGYQIRAMATCPTVRQQGMGLKLLKTAEKIAFESGASYLWANARKTAIGFYQKAGYTVDNHEFNIAGVGKHHLVWLTRSAFQ